MPDIRHEWHYGARVMPCFAERPSSIGAMFREAVAADPDAIAVVEGARRTSYRELADTVDRVAANLVALGARKGDRVALLIGSRTAFIELCLACGQIGVIQVPMNVRSRKPEIEYLLTHSASEILVYEADLEAQIPDAAALPALRHRIVIGGAVAGVPSYDSLLAPAPPPPEIAIAEDDPFCLIYTSGTTGRPKGAVLTHVSLIHSCLNYEWAMDLRRGDCSIQAGPFSHVTGLVALTFSLFRVAGRVVIMPAFKARAFLELASAERMTFAVMVPAMYNLCLLDPEFDRFDLSAWRVGGYGGAPMPEATVHKLAEKLPGLTLVNVYGATETSGPVVVMPRGEGVTRSAVIGRVLPCCDVRMMDDDGREVPAGASGELWIAGAMVVPGYWENPTADATGFTHGYWRSGDIGSIDADGYVRVFDRKKDMINRGGYKIYSVEVENVLSHHPDVVEAAVVGQSDPVLGERVHAFIVRRRPDLTREDIRAFCAERLSNYKVPDHVTFQDDPLPRNATGKLQKVELRKLVQAG